MHHQSKVVVRFEINYMIAHTHMQTWLLSALADYGNSCKKRPDETLEILVHVVGMIRRSLHVFSRLTDESDYHKEPAKNNK